MRRRMRISAEEVDRYRDSLSAVQEQARAYVEASIRALVALNPDLSVAELREYGAAVLEQAMRVYGDQSCALACMEYDAVARELGYDLAPAEISNDVDLDRIDRDSRYLAGLIERRGVEEFARRMASKARDHVLFSANRTMGANAARERDRESGMRYARVPSGRETCGFCLMLASQGFVYSSARAAGQRGGLYNSFHSHCDCAVMPGDDLTEIDGYDPDWLLEVYQDARAAVEHDARAAYDAAGGEDGTGKKYDKFLRDLIAKEIETRDRDWAWTGKVPESVILPGANPNAEERATISRLGRHGFRVESRPTRDLEMLKTSDTFFVYLPDDGGEERRVAWEIKNAHGNGTQTIYHQFEDAAGQSHRVVIDLANTPDGGLYDDADYALERARKFIKYRYKVEGGFDDGAEWTFDEAILLLKDGSMRRVTRGD